ncbi:hypothetical protein G7Z17_g2522 [Cylindrodendrum hubeiense]|uniref:Methyltransferase n=1 Tax=Cylindrodendrum hubeiense TaxID=595255 RepID=A0A9P5HGD3_9HYPO|nr:hypothetical protein G7Z17_g2522 [Cylindrodendrum hubeiense]
MASPAPPDTASPADPSQTSEGGVQLHSAEHWAQLAETDPVNEDDDSAVGVDTASSTASITSSILQYRTINGRTYHSERGNAEYWTPNDEHHNESMDINHHLLSLSLKGKLFLAPLKDDVQKVLDIGTGTGIWAIFVSNSTHVGAAECNIDCTEEWTFKPDSIDFVHMRYLYGSIGDWSALIKEAYRACKPGGWVESYEASAMMESDDGTVTETCAINEWGKFFIEGGKKLGRTFTILDDDLQRKCMEEAGHPLAAGQRTSASEKSAYLHKQLLSRTTRDMFYTWLIWFSDGPKRRSRYTAPSFVARSDPENSILTIASVLCMAESQNKIDTISYHET